MRVKSFVLVMAVVVLVWFGFRVMKTLPKQKMDARLPVAQETLPPKEITWIPVVDGIDRFDGMLPGTDIRLVLYRFAAGKFVWKVAAGQAKSVGEWALALPHASFVANGGYFHEDGTPSGYLVAQGVRVGTRQFDVDRAAFLVLGKQPHIISPSVSAKMPSVAADVVQSYPVLVADGKATVATESGYDARRTFVAMDQEGRTYVGLIPDRFVTLRQLSLGLAAFPATWKTALNLDGGPSSGAFVRSEEAPQTFPSFSAVANVVYAEPVGLEK